MNDASKILDEIINVFSTNALSLNHNPESTNSNKRSTNQKLFNIIKTLSSVIFDSIEIGNCIYKTFQNTQIDNILENLIQFEKDNIIDIISCNIKNNNTISRKWDDKTDNVILYQLLLAIYKDNKTNIANILKEFIGTIPQNKTNIIDFRDCNARHIIDILVDEVFEAGRNDVDPKFYNKIIQYIIENNINGKTFHKNDENDIVNGLKTFINDMNCSVSEKVISKLYEIKDDLIWKCSICEYANSVSNARVEMDTKCVGCNSILRIKSDLLKSKTRNLIKEDVKSEEDAKKESLELGDLVIDFFNKRRGKEFDDAVFVSLFELIGNDHKGLNKMRYDNYSVVADKKEYSIILMSFIGWIAAIKCDNIGCEKQLKLMCSCEKKQFQLFTYSIILSIISRDNANDNTLLDKLRMNTKEIRDIERIADEFEKILSEKLKSDNYFQTVYKKYIVEWIAFELYNFECECGHVNKSILIDRMFQYAINLNHCRLCHRERLPMQYVASSNSTIKNVEINTKMDAKYDKEDGIYPQYQSGVSIRYNVLKPKYGSLVEEITMNSIMRIQRQTFNDLLKQAQIIYARLKQENKIEITAVSEEHNKYFGIESNQLISVSHLVVVLIYAEKVRFARKFNEAYRYWQDTNLFCENFYWLGRYIYEAVRFFGERFDHNRFKIKPLLHCLATPMQFTSFAPTIYFPAPTNEQITLFDTTGCILSYAPKYIGSIDDTKCVKTSQWSGFNNHEWLFMGSSKLLIHSITFNQQDFTMYNYGMLYLEKILTQTKYDFNYYNTINNILYLPEVRQLASVLISKQLQMQESKEEIPEYINNIFTNWCMKRKSVTLETYSEESRFMSSKMREFLVDSSNTVQLQNLVSLFPNLETYCDVSGRVRGIKDYSINNDVLIQTETIYASTPSESWECASCSYNNIPLMVNSLWRYYNKLNECNLCGLHKHIQKESNELQRNLLTNSEEQLPIPDLERNKDKIQNGFGDNAECLIGKTHITKLSSALFVHLLDEYILDDIKWKNESKRQIMKERRKGIISCLRENNINGNSYYNESKKALKLKIVEYCDNENKLLPMLRTIFTAIDKFDLRNLFDDEKDDGTVNYALLQKYCSSTKRLVFILKYFERITSELSNNNDRYPHDIKRLLLSLPNYGPVKLLNDIDHVMCHSSTDSFECKENIKCIHFKRSRRHEYEQDFSDIKKKRALFNSDNSNDFIYIDMLDRLHTLLKHSQDMDHNKHEQMKKLKDDVRDVGIKFSTGVYMEYCSLNPLYPNLKQEIVQKKNKVTLDAFSDELNKVKQFMKSNSGILHSRSCKTDDKYGIMKSDLIRVEHIFCIMLYCNFTHLCTVFRKTYRKMNHNDTVNMIICNHINNFYWFGRWLTNAIEFFGKPASEKDAIYHGISDKCLFDHFSTVFEIPTSTTISFKSATNFMDGTGNILKLSPKFKNQLNISRYIDVYSMSIADFKKEKELLFAGMPMMAITNIYDTCGSKWINYKEWIQSILYLERIIEQTVHTRNHYNHGVITKNQTKEKWMKRQKECLVPLLKHQMNRNLMNYKEYFQDVGFDPVIPNEFDIPPHYVHSLFEHFCDNKSRTFIDFSCINLEIDTMDVSLQNLLFKNTNVKWSEDKPQLVTHATTQSTEVEINKLFIKAIFPNAEEFKNHNGEWKRLPILNDTFQAILEQREIQERELRQMRDRRREQLQLREVQRLEEKEQRVGIQQIPETQYNNYSNEEKLNTGIISQIDQCLARYYILCGRKDYYNADGVGVFQNYCDEGELDDDDVEEELTNAQDCMLTEIENFPLQHETHVKEEREVAIFNIIMECKKNQHAFFSLKSKVKNKWYNWTPTAEFFNVSEKEVEETMKLYQTQCKSFWDNGLKTEKTIQRLIAIGHKNGIPSYAQSLADMYIRDKIKKKQLSIHQWGETNSYMKQVKAMNPTVHAEIINAIKLMNHRITPPITFPPLYQIKEDLQEITEYITGAYHTLLHWMPKTGSALRNPPWQFDLPILFKNVSKIQTLNEKPTDDDDDDDDDEYDDYEDKKNNHDEFIGNPYDAIKARGLTHHTAELHVGHGDISTNIVRKSNKARAFSKIFDTFAWKGSSKGESLSDKHDKYPKYHRVCAILDRRGIKERDTITFVNPESYNQMDHHYVPEWFLLSSKQSLFPHSNEQTNQIQTMSANTCCNGKMMLLSFHVESFNEIKCYLYYDGKRMRFLPYDIIDVLPHFFDPMHPNDKFETNKNFVQSRDISEMTDEFRLEDSVFDSLLQYSNSTKT